jgi:integrase
MQVVERFEFRQAKTGRNVLCSLTPAAREALRDLIAVQNKSVADYLWTAKDDFHGLAITRAMYRRIVKGWAVVANLDPRRFSGHSTRRTKVTLLYAKTRDVKACAQLLGHANLGHTSAYIGADGAAALDLALTIQF